LLLKKAKNFQLHQKEEIMKKFLLVTVLAAVSMFAYAGEDAVLIKNLSLAKLSLKEAVALAEKTSGPATSAKFEMDGDQLVFSVYTAPQGLEASPEETDLTEISGSATTLPAVGKAEVFADKEHIARASAHLTLKQLSRFTLSEIIDIALKAQEGTVYSVKNPSVKNHKAIAEVLILTGNGHTESVNVDMLTGKIIH
jgi:uncharacterized membrane protein YkoI